MTGSEASGPEADPGSDCRAMRADARRNYEKLVQAARRVLLTEGGGASMEAISREAGVGVGTLYRHFPRRIDIVEAVFRGEVEGVVEAAEKSLSEPDPGSALAGWLRVYVDYARGKRVFLNELHEAFEKNPALKSSTRDRITEACGRVLRRAQEAGMARRDIDGDDLMVLLSTMCMSPTLTPDQGDRLLGMVLDGLRAG
jgi:AcrR family transcriptional regulator